MPEEVSNDIVAGFEDGTVRLLQYGKSTTNMSHCLILLQALRPHGERVTAVKQSPDCSLIATGSSDKTIFIFKKQQKGLRPVLEF